MMQGSPAMSYIVLHMDKFKKEAVRGIQSHNLRERKSHSNPDIDPLRRAENYELHDGASANYAEAIQSRIDDLLLTKAVRHDAVRMCGLIVSSDREFFWRLGPEETRRFFEESKSFLTDFVGKENVLSAMVHMDEKTPHMHFLHVPVINGRLNAKGLYTRDSLKRLQTEFHRHLHSKGFDIQRGVEQEPGSKKKHLDTREFKQQQEALNTLQADADALEKEVLFLAGKVDALREQESALQERLQSYEAQAKEAEKILQDGADIPEASVFSFKAALEKARQIIELQKQALAIKQTHADKARRLEDDVAALQAKLKKQQTETQLHGQQAAEKINTMQRHIDNLQTQLDEILPFMYQHHITYEYNKFFEQQKVAQKQQEEKARQEALHRQQAEERERASQSRQASAYRGMRMCR